MLACPIICCNAIMFPPFIMNQLANVCRSTCVAKANDKLVALFIRHTPCGDTSSVFFNFCITNHRTNPARQNIQLLSLRAHERDSAMRNPQSVSRHPEARKRAEKTGKAEEWQLRVSPPDPSQRGLFPRHLCGRLASFFVHLPIQGQTAPAQGGGRA